MIHVRGRRVYLSGPMTGIKDWNKPAFKEAERKLLSLGIVTAYNPTDFIAILSEAPHEVSMFYSIHFMMQLGNLHHPYLPYYEVLVSLPGWEQSAGARLERDVAVACGIEVCNLDEVVE